MEGIIKLLSQGVANQIAAGEVIQRPSSALKELLENAIDSGASDITAVIKDSGKTLIQVIDNGCGMSKDDAILCFQRHATSKINTAEDLFSIQSLGFRGEALASIASIAQVELQSRLKGDETGNLIRIEGSEIKHQSVCSCNEGTSIKVKNLFYNVPARRKFLKSNNAEMRHILEEFQRQALPNYSIGFELYHNDKVIYQLHASSLIERMNALFGKNYNKKVLKVDQETDIIKVSGYIGKPENARKTRGEQYFFVNKRFIKHAYLNHAVESTYDELIPEKNHPPYFLFLSVDPSKIDINIHPTKTEINFQDQQIIYSIIKSSVKKSIGEYSLSPSFDFNNESAMDVGPMPSDRTLSQPVITTNPDYNPFDRPDKNTSIRKENNQKNWERLYPYEGEIKQLDMDDHFVIPPEKDEISKDQSIQDVETKKSLFQLKNSYIITSVKSGLMIIDQHAAHMRILYDNFLNKLENQSDGSQQLLFPQSINMPPQDADLLRELIPKLKKTGFEIENFGGNDFIINGVPDTLTEKDLQNIIEGILENYKNTSKTEVPGKGARLALSMAGKMSIQTGMKLEPEEMNKLIDELFACHLPTTAPDGRPTLKIVSIDDVNNLFSD